MGLTPTSIIATVGLMKGDGLAISEDMKNTINGVESNPMIAAIKNLKSNANVGNVAGLTDTINSLPSFIANTTAVGSAILTQAEGILPGQGTMMGNKNFIEIYNGAAGFGSFSAEYSAALSEFGGKSFADMGIGVKNFSQMASNGVGSLIKDPNLSAASGALISSNLSAPPGFDPATGKTIVGGGLQMAGEGLQNFGSLFDFKNLNTLGSPSNLVGQLQKQGLSQKYGVDDKIRSAGYDPNNLNAVPDSVMRDILSSVSENDTKKIIDASGARVLSSAKNLNDLLHVERFMPPQAMQALGIAQMGVAGIKGLGNTLTNLGTQIDNFKIKDLITSIEARGLKYLDSLTSLIPMPIQMVLKPFLGVGSGPFGNPTLGDIVGTAAGVTHTDAFKKIDIAVKAVYDSPEGKELEASATELNNALNTGGDTTAPYARFQTAVDKYKSKPWNTAIQQSQNAALAALDASTAHLQREVSNLALAGKQLYTGVVNLGSSVNDFLAFGVKLPDLGVDKLRTGAGDLIKKMSSDTLFGEALKVSVDEGKNLSISQAAGKSTPNVANQSETTQKASAAELPGLETKYNQLITERTQLYNQYAALSEAINSGPRGMYGAIQRNDPRVAQLDEINAKFESKASEANSALDKLNSAYQGAGKPTKAAV